MIQTEEEKLVPELRFPSFTEDWDKMKLKDVSSYFNGGSYENDVKEEGKYELITLKSINTGGNLISSKRYIDTEIPTLTKGTLVMILSEQAPGLLGITALIPADNKYVLNQRVAEIRPNQKVNNYFLSMVINRNQRYFSKHGAGTKVQNISKPNVQNYKFLLPKILEQQKIATFLTAVDQRIQLLQRKKVKLEEYKKGVMQRLFAASPLSVSGSKDSQDQNGKEDHPDVLSSGKSSFRQLRFKDENGNDFPDWEEKKFGDAVKRVKRKYDPKINEHNFRCIELESLSQNTGELLHTFDSKEQKSVKNKFEEEHILFGKLRPYLKKYYKATFEGVCSSEIWVLTGNKN